MIAPIDGTVLEINARLRNEPILINGDPYGEGWALRVRLTRPGDIGHLNDASTYLTLMGLTD
jgi:glycine cleavage system H protein